MGLMDRAVMEYLLLSTYVKLLLKLSFHICVEMQILFLMLIFYSFCSSAEIITICNQNVLIELMVYFFLVFLTVDVKMQAVTVEPIIHLLW